MLPVLGALTTTSVPLSGDFTMADIVAAVGAAAGAWIVGTLLYKAGIAGIAATFKMLFRGMVRIVGSR